MTETRTTSATYDRIAPTTPLAHGARCAGRVAAAFRCAAGGWRARAGFGCGPAHDTAALRALGLRAAGFDRSRGMLAQARRRSFRYFWRHCAACRCAMTRWMACGFCASFLHFQRAMRRWCCGNYGACRDPTACYSSASSAGRASAGSRIGSGGQRFFVFYQEDELDLLLTESGFTVREGWLDADHLGRPEPWIARWLSERNHQLLHSQDFEHHKDLLSNVLVSFQRYSFEPISSAPALCGWH